jgi:GT2 family glycosyltransferase
MTMTRPIALTVVADSRAGASESSPALSRFRKQVELNGGVWIDRGLSFHDIVEQVTSRCVGEYVLFLGKFSEPEGDLLQKLSYLAQRSPQPDVAYGDFFDAPAGSRAERIFLPRWSPTRLEFENYIGDSFLVRASFLVSLNILGDSNAAWNSWDFLLSCAQGDAQVTHAREVWTRQAQSYPRSVRALSRAAAEQAGSAGSLSYDLITMTAGSSDATINDGAPFIDMHLTAIHGQGHKPQGNHFVIVGDECDHDVRLRLAQSPHIELLHAPGRFNFARRGNLGRLHSQAQVLIFVNDDFVPTRSDWLELLLAPFQNPLIGATGATLLFDDNTLQHVGVGIKGRYYDHEHQRLSADDSRLQGLLAMNREVDAVTGACFAIRSSVFDATGGFFEGFPLNYNDVDLCLKVRESGYSIVHVGAPIGIHYESKTRPPVLLAEEIELMDKRWPQRPASSEFPFHLRRSEPPQ